jgi:hypothetical protein
MAPSVKLGDLRKTMYSRLHARTSVGTRWVLQCAQPPGRQGGRHTGLMTCHVASALDGVNGTVVICGERFRFWRAENGYKITAVLRGMPTRTRYESGGIWSSYDV